MKHKFTIPYFNKDIVFDDDVQKKKIITIISTIILILICIVIFCPPILFGLEQYGATCTPSSSSHSSDKWRAYMVYTNTTNATHTKITATTYIDGVGGGSYGQVGYYVTSHTKINGTNVGTNITHGTSGHNFHLNSSDSLTAHKCSGGGSASFARGQSSYSIAVSGRVNVVNPSAYHKNNYVGSYANATVTVPALPHLDVNGNLDGTDAGNIAGYGTCDVYIGGSLVSNDCTDFYTGYVEGTSYKINDIRPTAGHIYTGAAEYSGTISASGTGVRLVFKTNPTATVTFSGNGIGADMTQSINHLEAFYFPSPINTPGYEFVEWNTASNGSGISYSPGDLYKNANSSQNIRGVTVIPGGETIYAIWRETGTIYYNANGHGTAPASQTVYKDSAANVANALTDSVWTFKEWNTEPTGSGESFSGGSKYKNANTNKNIYGTTITPNGSQTLYAIWQREGTITIVKHWDDGLTGDEANNREPPEVKIRGTK